MKLLTLTICLALSSASQTAVFLKPQGIRFTIPSRWNVIVDNGSSFTIGDFNIRERVKAVMSPPGHGHIMISTIPRSYQREHIRLLVSVLTNRTESDRLVRTSSRSSAMLTTITGSTDMCRAYNYLDIGESTNVVLVTGFWFCEELGVGTRIRAAVESVVFSVRGKSP